MAEAPRDNFGVSGDENRSEEKKVFLLDDAVPIGVVILVREY